MLHKTQVGIRNKIFLYAAKFFAFEVSMAQRNIESYEGFLKENVASFEENRTWMILNRENLIRDFECYFRTSTAKFL